MRSSSESSWLLMVGQGRSAYIQRSVGCFKATRGLQWGGRIEQEWFRTALLEGGKVGEGGRE